MKMRAAMTCAAAAFLLAFLPGCAGVLNRVMANEVRHNIEILPNGGIGEKESRVVFDIVQRVAADHGLKRDTAAEDLNPSLSPDVIKLRIYTTTTRQLFETREITLAVAYRKPKSIDIGVNDDSDLSDSWAVGAIQSDLVKELCGAFGKERVRIVEDWDWNPI